MASVNNFIEGPFRSCSEEDFACDNLDCALPVGVCNGIADCQDLSDETSCGRCKINPLYYRHV